MCQLIRTLQHDISECTFYLLPDTLPKQMPLVPLHREVIARNMFCHVNRIESNNQILRLSPSVSVSFMLVWRLPSPSTLLPICHWLKKPAKKKRRGWNWEGSNWASNMNGASVMVCMLQGSKVYFNDNNGMWKAGETRGEESHCSGSRGRHRRHAVAWTVNSEQCQPSTIAIAIYRHPQTLPSSTNHFQTLPIIANL